jgi:enoyl-CoA hydratase/carnithine racemase
MSEHILVERHGAVQSIRMNRPEKKNALTRAMYAEMARALREGDADSAVRCHVILGFLGLFRLATILPISLRSPPAANGTEVWDFLLALAELQAARIGRRWHRGRHRNHHQSALRSDFATSRTIFRTPFVDLGLVPEAGSSLLAPRILGRQEAFALLALGEGFTAERARSAGLIYRIVGEDELDGAVFAAAGEIASSRRRR